MTLVAHLHGAPDRLPFVGHFRAAASAEDRAYSVAGRVADRGDVLTAFRAARAVEAVLSGVRPADSRDRVDLLERVWAAIGSLDGCDLGDGRGSDLVALIAIRDAQGMGIAGPGLGGVWAWKESGLSPLVEGQHPLLAGPGRPDRLPGMLTLDAPCPSVVAVAHDHPVPTLKLKDLARSCGVNP